MGRTLGKDAKLVNFRASQEDIDRWKEDGYLRRMGFSRWIRYCLDNYPGKNGSVSSPSPIRVLPSAAPEVKERVSVLAEELVEKAKISKEKKTVCERRLPKGAFCKTCGRIHP